MKKSLYLILSLIMLIGLLLMNVFAAEESHTHNYGEWTEVSAPTKEALGVQKRVCVCGSTETKEVEGVWQMYDLADHLSKLPENVCSDTNLWALLPHENVHFTSGKRWGTNSTPVTSITIPLNPGDRVYATSWNKAGENGHETLNGIRLTFFNSYGIAQTLGPGESYNKFAANGGYLVAPKETIAINIAMWYDSEDYEVYILNREHSYEEVTIAPNCTELGYSGTICLGCGGGTYNNYIAPLGHKLSFFEAKASTCTTAGWNAYETCSRCNHSTYKETPSLGHSYELWTQIIAPTCNSEGKDKSVCTNCKETIYRDTRISGDSGKILVSNPVPEGHYEGKRILAIGDSLTAGTGVTKEQRYHALLAQRLNAINISGGTSGATLCPGGHLPNKFETLMTANYLIENNIDIVTIFLGINDWDNGVVNGTYQGKLKYDESLTYYDLGEFGTDDTTTIYGAAKMWCERILELKATAGCEDIQFVFATSVITSLNKSVTTARDWNQDKVNVFGYTLRQYCTAVMEVCAYYEIPVLDLNMYSGMYYHSETDNNVDYFGGDGIHPGVNGHAMMADAFVEFLLEGYSYEFRIVSDCGHSFEETVTEATCTKGGFTTYRCPQCHYSCIDSYVDALGHICKNGTCLECGVFVNGFARELDGIRYYYADRSFAKGWQTIEGKTYRFDGNGILFEGESLVYGVYTYWFGEDHATLEGLVLDAGGYRFYKGGVRQYGWVDFDADGKGDSYFYVSSQLRCEEDRVLFDGVDARRFFVYDAETGYMTVANGFYTNENGTQFFKNGMGQYGWITADGVSITDRPGITLSDVHYFAYGDGLNFYMVEDSVKTIGGVVREFDENHLVKAYTGWSVNKVTGNENYYVEGVLQQGWCETPDGWVYLSRSENLENNITYGDVSYGWKKIGGKVYYFRAGTSDPKYVIISDPSRDLTYDGVRETYYINQPADPETATGADYFITNPPAGF